MRLGGLAQHARSNHPGDALRSLVRFADIDADDDIHDARLAALLPEILYEDDEMIVVVKPAGVETRDFSHKDEMIVFAGSMRAGDKRVVRGRPHIIESSEGCVVSEGRVLLKTPQPVHRLDRDTAGCLVLAKTQLAKRKLDESFSARSVKKRYRAIVAGDVAAEGGLCEVPLEGGKACRTVWSLIQRDRSVTHSTVCTLDLWPETGRKHQLRRHMEMIGHPIIGDTIYSAHIACIVRTVSKGDGGVHSVASSSTVTETTDICPGVTGGSSEQSTQNPEAPPLMLWAASLSLPHPTLPGTTITVEAAPEPPVFKSYRETEAAPS